MSKQYDMRLTIIEQVNSTIWG